MGNESRGGIFILHVHLQDRKKGDLSPGGGFNDAYYAGLHWRSGLPTSDGASDEVGDGGGEGLILPY